MRLAREPSSEREAWLNKNNPSSGLILLFSSIFFMIDVSSPLKTGSDPILLFTSANAIFKIFMQRYVPHQPKHQQIVKKQLLFT
jgi:hypothetical protein